MNGPASARRKVCITIKSVNLNVRVLFGGMYRLFSVQTAGFFFFFFPPSPVTPDGTVLLVNLSAQTDSGQLEDL